MLPEIISYQCTNCLMVTTVVVKGCVDVELIQEGGGFCCNDQNWVEIEDDEFEGDFEDFEEEEEDG